MSVRISEFRVIQQQINSFCNKPNNESDVTGIITKINELPLKNLDLKPLSLPVSATPMNDKTVEKIKKSLKPILKKLSNELDALDKINNGIIGVLAGKNREDLTELLTKRLAFFAKLNKMKPSKYQPEELLTPDLLAMIKEKDTKNKYAENLLAFYLNQLGERFVPGDVQEAIAELIISLKNDVLIESFVAHLEPVRAEPVVFESLLQSLSDGERKNELRFKMVQRHIVEKAFAAAARLLDAGVYQIGHQEQHIFRERLLFYMLKSDEKDLNLVIDQMFFLLEAEKSETDDFLQSGLKLFNSIYVKRVVEFCMRKQANTEIFEKLIPHLSKVLQQKACPYAVLHYSDIAKAKDKLAEIVKDEVYCQTADELEEKWEKEGKIKEAVDVLDWKIARFPENEAFKLVKCKILPKISYEATKAYFDTLSDALKPEALQAIIEGYFLNLVALRELTGPSFYDLFFKLQAKYGPDNLPKILENIVVNAYQPQAEPNADQFVDAINAMVKDSAMSPPDKQKIYYALFSIFSRPNLPSPRVFNLICTQIDLSKEIKPGELFVQMLNQQNLTDPARLKEKLNEPARIELWQDIYPRLQFPAAKKYVLTELYNDLSGVNLDKAAWNFLIENSIEDFIQAEEETLLANQVLTKYYEKSISQDWKEPIDYQLRLTAKALDLFDEHPAAAYFIKKNLDELHDYLIGGIKPSGALAAAFHQDRLEEIRTQVIGLYDRAIALYSKHKETGGEKIEEEVIKKDFRTPLAKIKALKFEFKPKV